MLFLGRVEPGDIQEMSDIQLPTADIIRIMKAVLLLLGKLSEGSTTDL